MEFPSVKQKTPKHTKSKKKQPFKVVYISNPVKFTASPDQFRAVVQQLTGRDSDASKLPGAYDEVTDFSKEAGNKSIATTPEIAYQMNIPDQCHNGACSSSYGSLEAVFEMFGEKIIPELFESYDPRY